MKVIVVRGAGRAFCAGYDFGGGFRHWGRRAGDGRALGPGQGLRDGDGAAAVADPEADERLALPEAVIAQVHGWCVGGAATSRSAPTS